MVAEEAPVEHTSREEAELRSCEQELAELEAEHQCTAERSQALVRNIDALGGRERELAQELAEISVLITLTRAVHRGELLISDIKTTLSGPFCSKIGVESLSTGTTNSQVGIMTLRTAESSAVKSSAGLGEVVSSRGSPSNIRLSQSMFPSYL